MNRLLLPHLLGLALLGGALGCKGPRPPEALVDLRTGYGTVYGTSTESGILVLSELVEGEEELSFRYHIGNGMFDDVATVATRGHAISILDAVSSTPNEVRFAARPAEGDEQLFVESRATDGDPALVGAHLHARGIIGNLLSLDSQEPLASAARRLAGCGLYVYRAKHMQLVGVMNGVYVEELDALAYVGLDEIAHVLPRTSAYFERQAQPYRADFEYGIPRDFLGEQPHASGLTSDSEPAAGGAGRESPTAGGDLEQLLRELGTDDG